MSKYHLRNCHYNNNNNDDEASALLTVDGAFVLDGFGLVGGGLVGDRGGDGGGYKHEGDQHLNRG